MKYTKSMRTVALAVAFMAGLAQAASAGETESESKLILKPGIIDKNVELSAALDVSDIWSPLEAMFVSYEAGPDSDGPSRGQLALEKDYVVENGTLKLSAEFLDELHAGEHSFVIEMNRDRLDFKQSVNPGGFSVSVLSDGSLPAVTADEDALKTAALKSEECVETLSRGYNVSWDLSVSEAESEPELAAIERNADGSDIAALVNIGLSRKTRDATVEQLNEVDGAVAMSINVPEDLAGQSSLKVARSYTNKNGLAVYDELPSELSGDGSALLFQNDKFGATFAVLSGDNHEENAYPTDMDEMLIGESIAEGYYTGEYDPYMQETADGFEGITSEDDTAYTDDNAVGYYTEDGFAPEAEEDREDEPAHAVQADPRELDERPYIGGYPDGSFKPENCVTRAELAQFLFNLFGDGYNSNGKILRQFSDAQGHWAEQALGWAVASGYLNGCGDGTLRPSEPATRAQFAAVMRNVGTEQGVLNRLGSYRVAFSDVLGHWAQTDIMIMAGSGTMRGYDDGTFKPDNPITRAEAVTAINRMLNRSRGFREDKVFTDVKPGYPSYNQIMNAANGN